VLGANKVEERQEVVDFCSKHGIHCHSEREVTYQNTPTIVGHLLWQVGKFISGDPKANGKRSDSNFKTPCKKAIKPKAGILSPKYMLFNGA
jgi:hypothetical protein